MSGPRGDAAGAAPDAASTPAVSGQVAFYDNVLPALPAGDYQIIVQDSVTADQEDASYATVQRFRVTGPNLALGPGDVQGTRGALAARGVPQ